MLERRFREGVRLDAQSRLETLVVCTKPDPGRHLEPTHILAPDGPLCAECPSGSPRPTFGYFGACKAPDNRRLRSSVPGQFGEDVVAAEVIKLPRGSGFEMDWLFVADGHGGRGHKTAVAARAAFKKRWRKLAPDICFLTGEGRIQEACDFMQAEGYDHVVSCVEQKALSNCWTGSTVTQMLTVRSPEGRRIVYTSNMGDSPGVIMLLSGGRAAERTPVRWGRPRTGPRAYVTTAEHSWEDEVEMQRYLQHVWQKREAALSLGMPEAELPQPISVCYGAFNCGSYEVLPDVRSALWNSCHRATDRRPSPIKMWQYPLKHDGSGWDLVLDRAASQHVWRAAQSEWGDDMIGGTQSQPAKRVLVSGQEGWPFAPLFPSSNWGSCWLAGSGRRGSQMTRSIADFKESVSCHTIRKASFMAFDILPDEEVVQIVMSDGVGDVVGFQAMCEHFARKVPHDRKGSRLARETLRMVREKVPFSAGPAHDDCSVALLHRPALISSAPRRHRTTPRTALRRLLSAQLLRRVPKRLGSSRATPP